MPARPVIGPPLVGPRVVSDLVLWENDKRYTRSAIQLAAGTYLIGQIIVNATLSALGHVGFAPTVSDVLCLEDVIVPAGQTWDVPALVRGPALVNMDEVIRIGAETDAALKVRLADLIAQGVVFVREPVRQTVPVLSA